MAPAQCKINHLHLVDDTGLMRPRRPAESACGAQGLDLPPTNPRKLNNLPPRCNDPRCAWRPSRSRESPRRDFASPISFRSKMDLLASRVLTDRSRVGWRSLVERPQRSGQIATRVDRRFVLHVPAPLTPVGQGLTPAGPLATHPCRWFAAIGDTTGPVGLTPAPARTHDPARRGTSPGWRCPRGGHDPPGSRRSQEYGGSGATPHRAWRRLPSPCRDDRNRRALAISAPGKRPFDPLVRSRPVHRLPVVILRQRASACQEPMPRRLPKGLRSSISRSPMVSNEHGRARSQDPWRLPVDG